MTTRTRLSIIFVTAPVLVFVVVGGLLARGQVRGEAYSHLRVFDDVFSLTTNGYVETVDAGRLMHGAMHGLADSLDADSAYLTIEEAAVAARREAGPAGDVGLVLTRQYYLRVVAVTPGSPAARAGLRGGDYLRMIDRTPTRDMSAWEGTRLLRGKPGTAVALTVLRGNAVDTHAVTVTREKVVVAGPSASMAAPGIGTIRLLAIDETTPAAVKDRAARLQREGAASLILDLRGCATGPLAAGLAVARVFVGSGVLGQLAARGAAPETINAAAGDGVVALPLVVLADTGTSGAAEVLAAAIQGNKRGVVIGERTLGRTAMQKLFPLPDGSALWMSYARYMAVSGDPIHERGIQPDVVVEEPDVEFGSAPPAGDPAMERALERLRTRSASQASLP